MDGVTQWLLGAGQNMTTPMKDNGVPACAGDRAGQPPDERARPEPAPEMGGGVPGRILMHHAGR